MRRWLPAPPAPVPDLDWSADRARELTDVAVGLWAELLDELPERRIAPGEPRSTVMQAVAIDIPDRPLPLEEAEAWLRRFLDHSAHVGHPGFLAYVIGSGTIPGAVGDLFASATTPNAGGWQFSPAAHEVERLWSGGLPTSSACRKQPAACSWPVAPSATSSASSWLAIRFSESR